MAKPASNVIEFNKIKPKTRNQDSLFKAIQDNNLIICNGPAGSGKTICAIGVACGMLLEGKIEKILLARTIVACGEIGFLPGNENEKVEPYLMGHLAYFEKILGKGYKKYIGDGKIVLKPLETLRGTTFDNSMMILDESQNADGGQIKMFISRLGQNSKVILLGDVSQSDTNPTGFRFCLNYLDKLEGCQVVNLTSDDILRNKILKPILEVFDKNGY